MKLFGNFFDREKRKENARKRLVSRAEELFDMTCHDGQMWLCFNGSLIAPMSMLVNSNSVCEYVALIEVLRDCYVKRNL